MRGRRTRRSGGALAVARGEIRPDQVAIHWVETTDDGAGFVQLLELDGRGVPAGWPPGVLSEDVALARELLEVRRRQEQR